MKNCFYKFTLGLLSLTFCGCQTASTSSIAPLAAPSSSVEAAAAPLPHRAPSAPPRPSYRFKYADDLLSEKEKLSYRNFQIEKRRKPTIVDGKKHDEDGHQFAVLRRKGQIVARFDDLVNPLGTEVRFGLQALFGRNRKQLIIEQTENRGWQYWIVDLSRDAKVVHNAGRYNVGQGLRVLDIDGDGTSEVVQSLLTFWFFDDKVSNANSPFPDIVFAYDSQAKEYVPANHRYRDFVLRDVEEYAGRFRAAKSQRGRADFGEMLEVLLRYVYAGKEKEAWEFYEAECNLPDKAEMRLKIENELKADSVYQAISKSPGRPSS